MTIAHLGNYPPRACGIATFTENLFRAVGTHRPDDDADFIVAMNDADHTYDYPERVKFTIREQRKADYIKAANYVNSSGADVCMIQHEFGIFGGPDGKLLHVFTDHLRIPFAITFHTILKEPNDGQRAVMCRLGSDAAQVVVMSRKAVSFLQDIYHIPEEKISLIEHGAPCYEMEARDALREKLHFKAEAPVLLTFGLLGRGKGLETAIRALPTVVAEHPNVRYLILGRTHPNVVAHEGEAYRESLIEMARELGVADNLEMRAEFVEEDELCEYLTAADIYVTPYPNEAQITSGTLTYAIGAGAAIVSTPFWHAQELLEDGRGFTFNFNDPADLARQLNRLLGDEQLLRATRERSAAYGQTIMWPEQGKSYLAMLHEIAQDGQPTAPDADQLRALRRLKFPAATLRQIERLTDSTGIVQHAKYAIPNYLEGYCIDDNCRALITAALAHERKPGSRTADLVDTYLAFLFYVQRENGQFGNFVSYDRRSIDHIGSDDSFGRTVWSLGFFLNKPARNDQHQLAREMLDRSIPHIAALRSPRAVAYAIMGLSEFIEAEPSAAHLGAQVVRLAEYLAGLYEQVASADWQWFENYLTYANAILPLALLRAGRYAEDPTRLRGVADATSAFLTAHTFRNGILEPVGCHGFFVRGEQITHWDQQPIDVMLTQLLHLEYYAQDNDLRELNRAVTCFNWFHGKNTLNVEMYCPETGGCFDGLTRNGPNANQGAESTLAYWMAYYSLRRVADRLSEIEVRGSGKLIKVSDMLLPDWREGDFMS